MKCAHVWIRGCRKSKFLNRPDHPLSAIPPCAKGTAAAIGPPMGVLERSTCGRCRISRAIRWHSKGKAPRKFVFNGIPVPSEPSPCKSQGATTHVRHPPFFRFPLFLPPPPLPGRTWFAPEARPFIPCRSGWTWCIHGMWKVPAPLRRTEIHSPSFGDRPDPVQYRCPITVRFWGP